MPDQRDQANLEFVEWLQDRLGIPVDGWAGKATRNAVQQALPKQQTQQEEDTQEEDTQDKPEPVAPPEDLPDDKQSDYGQARLGHGLDRIQASGCLTCDAAMAASHEAGRTINAKELAEEIFAFNGYNKRSFIKWRQTLEALESLTEKSWVHHDTDEPFTTQRCAEYLQAGILPILHVSGKTKLKSHYVLACGVDQDGDIIIRDPGTGNWRQKADKLFGSERQYTALSFKILTTQEKWDAFNNA